MKNQTETKKRQDKTMVGRVVSTKMKNTIVVAVEHTHRHPLYKKAVRRTHKFASHNELAGVAVGDMVRIGSVRPISKTKHFSVIEKVKQV